MMSFCEANLTFSPEWIHNGLTHCFMDTVTSGLLFTIVAIFGFIEWILYIKYANYIESQHRPKTLLFRVQIMFTLFMPLIYITHLVLRLTYYEEKEAYIYVILSSCFYILSWPISLMLVFMERCRMLPTIPTRGHGLVLLVFWCFAFVSENLAFISFWSHDWFWYLAREKDKIEFGLWLSRYLLTFLLLLIGFRAPGVTAGTSRLTINAEDGIIDTDDTQTLVQGTDSSIRAQTGSTWADFWKKLRNLWPYMWPKKNVWLQLRVLICFLVLAGGRGVNILVPIYYKHIVDSLTIKTNSTKSSLESVQPLTAGTLGVEFRWDYILIWILLRFLQGGGFGAMGVLNNVRTFLWIRVQQYTTREIEVRLFSHLHALSLRWHLGRKTGEVLRVMDRGTTSINNLLSYIVFNIIPTIADIVIAVVYFITAFNIWFGVIVFGTMVLYLISTIAVTEWRTKFRREMNILDNDRNAKGVDSLLNFETVKYYGAADFEADRYNKAILIYQDAEWVSTASLNVLNSLQNVIITAGLIGGSMLCAWYVYAGDAVYGHVYTVGDFVLFATYIVQLYGPLNFFGTYYRMIQQSFVDMENMFDLLNEKQEVKDEPKAKALTVTKGMIEFNNVSFYYEPSRPILKNITFVVPPGQTFALVGHTGSGKSTIIRLLFRFYDIQEGYIKIDGQDISKVTQVSLRKTIGVVPQDTVLFNADIRYNIRYGRVGASEQEVENAAAASDIHHRIETFPDGYGTLVGERGLKLSGGEKQRVAIARTILKAPAFVLLDEATSALDTKTERNIQASLAKVCENRTSVVVAHRLSTVINADQILVLNEGVIVERGTHEELLAADGEYYDMWHQQMTKHEEEDNGASGSDTESKNGKDDSSISYSGRNA